MAPTKRLAVLLNFIPPYRVPVFQELEKTYAAVMFFLSTDMEPGRPWNPDVGNLTVASPRSISVTRKWRHPSGFVEKHQVHVPVGLLPALRRFGPDAILSGELGGRTAAAVIYKTFASRQRVRVVAWVTVSERTEQGRGPLRMMLRRWLAKHLDGYIVNGESGRRYLKDQLKVDASRVFIVPQPHHPDIAATHREPDASEEVFNRPLNLLYVGQVVPRKGLKRLLPVLDDVLEGNYRLEVIGAGPGLPALARMALRGKLITHGSISRTEDIRTIYARADCLIFPTLADEWGLVVPEALASGVPVLGSVYSQAMTELVRDGWNGWLFDPDDLNSTQTAIARMSQGMSGLTRLRENARRSVENLTPQVTARKISAAVDGRCARLPIDGGRR